MTDDLFDDPTATPTTPPAAKKTPKLYPIPAANFRRARCSGQGCEAVIYWVAGTRFPISTDCEGGRAPFVPWTDHEPDRGAEPIDGAGVSHYTNCPAAGQFSGRNRGR